MKGTMMQFPLTLRPLLERAARLFPSVEIVSSRPDNSIHRYTYGEMSKRARSLTAVLQATGLKPGDRVAYTNGKTAFIHRVTAHAKECR